MKIVKILQKIPRWKHEILEKSLGMEELFKKYSMYEFWPNEHSFWNDQHCAFFPH